MAGELRRLEYWMSARCQKLRCDRASNVHDELSCCGLRDCEELSRSRVSDDITSLVAECRLTQLKRGIFRV